MKGNGKRILSICLAVVIAVTSVWYVPPSFTASASLNTNMENAMELLASPSKALAVSTATPSEAGTSEKEATPSEAEILDGKATPSEAVKKFVKVEPEEIPDYYSQVSISGKKFWKFEDRNGMKQYRDYGYVQGGAEFPLWYVADLTGIVDDTSDSVNLDDEYYDLAPYIYKSVAPTKVNWSDLSWKLLNDSESIFLFDREESESFKNWNHSTYSIWSVNGLLESEEEADEEIQNTDLGYFFYGQIANKQDPVSEWYYADSKGTVWSMSNMLMASLLASNGSYTWYMDAPGDSWSTKGTAVNFSGKKVIGDRDDWRTITDVQREKGLDFHSKFIGWSSIRSSDNSLWVNDTYKYMTGDPAKTSRYTYGGTLYSKRYELDSDSYYSKNYYGIWCPENADMYIFASDNTNMHEAASYFNVQNVSYGTSGIIVRRNDSFDVSLVSQPSKNGWTFDGWNYYGNTGDILKVGDTLYCGSSGKVTWIFPAYTPRRNTVTFLDKDGSVLKEEQVLSGNSATAPAPPEIPGKRFAGWDTTFNYVTSDLTVKAQYKDTITLTIIGNGGTVYGQDTYVKELPINTDRDTALADIAKNIVREGYSARSTTWWKSLEEDGTETYLSYSLTKDVTVRIPWEINKYTVTFENIYETPKGKKTVTAEYGILYKDLTIPSFEVPYDYYEFDGYYNDLSINAVLISPETPVTKNVTYYAKFKPTYADVTWHTDMPGNDQITYSNVTIGTARSIWGIPSVPRIGYRDIGTTYWYTQPNGQGDIISDKILFDLRKLDAYAYWKPLRYYICCYRNWNSTDSTRTVVTHDFGLNDVVLATQEAPSGKVLIGYSTTKNGIDMYKDIHELPYTNASSNLYLYAQYANANNTVTFKDWNGAVIVKQTVPYGESAELPELPVRTGYRFIGWDKPYDNIKADMVLTAQYEISSHSLILDGNGGNFIGNTSITMEATAGESLDQALTDGKNNAIRKYYTFTGWYTDPSGGSKYSESGNIMPDADTTIYARWERSSSEVTFKDWNGTVLEKQEVTIGADATPPDVPERPGYTFTGWDKPTTNIQDHTDVTAQYSINGYLLTLNGNGGTLEESLKKEVVVSFDQSFDQILVDGKDQVKRPGYHFDGWYTSASGGSSYSYSGNQMPSMNVTVFAHWSVNTYKVTFDPNHEGWTGGVIKEDHDFDTEMGILPAPEIYGWKLTGWWTGKNGSGSRITEQTTVEFKDMVYYGNWEPLTYQVRFISNVEQPEGESVQTFMVSQTYDQVFKNLPEPVEKGYTFTGWYDEDNKKLNPQTIFQPVSGAEGDIYHAGWKANSYKIRFVYFDADGKQVSIEMNQEYPSQFGTLPTPEKQGYTFIGWFKDNGEEVIAGSWVEAGDVEYKARWKANQYTIHFERNLPESETMEDPEDKTVTYTLPIGVLPYLNETGYVFLGWFTEQEGGSRIRETTLAALGDQTYYGHWAIGFIDNGNGTNRRPGADGKWNTTDDELWWNGLDGSYGTSDDKQIFSFLNRIGSYADNGNGTHYRPGASENWRSGIELWWNGADGIPGTDDDIRIYNGGNGSSGTPIYYIDSGNGIYIRPGASGDWGSGTEYWWYGSDGIPGTADDRQIHLIPGGSGYYMDYGNGNYIKPGTGGSWTSGTEHWWYGPDGKPGTSDDRQIHIIPGGSGYYIDNGDGTYIKPGAGGSWTSGTEHWWYGPDGKPGTSDDKQIHIIPGGSGYYIDNGGGTYIKPGTGGSWENGTEHWWYGPDGKPGTSDDRQIHIIPGGSGYYIDNGDGTYIKPGTGGSWTSGTEHWWYGTDGTPGTSDDKQIHIIPGGSGYYIDNGDGTYILPGTGGSWTSGTEHWWYGPDGTPGTSDDRQIHIIPGGSGYYIDNGDGTHIRPGTGGSWDHGTEIWQNGPDGKPGTPDDYKKVDNGNTDPEPTKPDPTDPEPTKPEPTDPEPTKPEPSKPEPVKPEPANPSKPEPSNETKASKEDSEVVTVPGTPSIDSTSKPSVRDDGGTFKVDPENPKDITYIKPDGSPAINEWVGDGTDYYHVNEDSKLDYNWFLNEDGTWFMLNDKPGENFGAALRGWYGESMDSKRYFFEPGTTKMLTSWQLIDNKQYFFTPRNEGQTYFGSNRTKWKYDPNRPGKPYGSMYRNEYTPDGYWVDENGVCANKK
jgi:uncharacterized repeat protein (TIGR02543 family)